MRLTIEQTNKLKKLITDIFTNKQSYIINTDSGCKVSLFNEDGTLECTEDHYYFCIEKLARKLKHIGSAASYCKLINAWITEKEEKSTHIIDYLWDYQNYSNVKERN